MKDNRKKTSANLRGNIFLTFFSVFFGIAVLSASVYLWNRSEIAIPVVRDFFFTVFNSSAPSNSSNASNISSTTSGSSKLSEATSSAASSKASVSASRDLSNALFVGDSYTDGLTLYSTVSKTRAFSSNTMTTGSILKKKYSFKDKTMSVFEAVDNVSPRGIFIMLGSNDLASLVSAEKFSTNYSELVDKLKDACPDANIYIQSIIPITEKYSEKNKTGFTNENIKEYNETLKELCEEKNVTFLDIGDVLSNGTGVLPEKSSSDGYHLKSLAYSDWMTFLKNEK